MKTLGLFRQSVFGFVLGANCLILASTGVSAQISILNVVFNEHYISPATALNMVVMNTGTATTARASVVLTELGSGEEIIRLNSSDFQLNPGVNALTGGNIALRSVIYGRSNLANYVKVFRKLPIGEYKVCHEVSGLSAEMGADNVCSDFLKNYSDFIGLLSPFDGDTVYTHNPVLSWHSSFPIQYADQYRNYRLTLVEMKPNQKKQEALSRNPPMVVIDQLKAFNIPYPADAGKLENGKSYVWQVQSLFQNTVVDFTETWSFVVWDEPAETDVRYLELKTRPGAEFHKLNDELFYFSFPPHVSSVKESISCRITNEKNQLHTVNAVRLVQPTQPGHDFEEHGDVNVRKRGFHKYVLDLSKEGLPEGDYLMETIDDSGETYKARFQI